MSSVNSIAAEVKNRETLWDTASSAGVRGFPVTVINDWVIIYRLKMKSEYLGVLYYNNYCKQH